MAPSTCQATQSIFIDCQGQGGLHAAHCLVSVRALGSQDPPSGVNGRPPKTALKGFTGCLAHADQAGRMGPALGKQQMAAFTPTAH